MKNNKQNIINEAKFLYLGCPACGVCGSIITQMVKGKTLEQAKSISEKEVIEELGGLPGNECHCAILVLTTLNNTIKEFEKK